MASLVGGGAKELGIHALKLPVRQMIFALNQMTLFPELPIRH